MIEQAMAVISTSNLATKDRFIYGHDSLRSLAYGFVHDRPFPVPNLLRRFELAMIVGVTASCAAAFRPESSWFD